MVNPYEAPRSGLHPKCAPQQAWRIDLVDGLAGVQAAARLRIDFVQNAQATLHHQTQLPADTPREGVHKIGAFLHGIPCPVCVSSYEFLNVGCDFLCCQCCAGDAKLGAVHIGQIARN